MPERPAIRKSAAGPYHGPMVAVPGIEERMSALWEVVAPRLMAYRLVLPGAASFVCQASFCEANCCRVFSVALGDREVERLGRASGLPVSAFLELEDGEPVALPLAQPYLLARSESRCRLLGPDLGCTQYEGRPDACRLYPHFVLFFEPATGRPIHADLAAMGSALEWALAGAREARCIPLLLRHVECPGFTGPLLGQEAWNSLLEETAHLQYPDLGGGDWPVT